MTSTQTNREYSVLNPVNSKVIAKVQAFTTNEVEEVLERIHGGQRDWAQAPRHERVRIIETFVESVYQNREMLASTLMAENGKIHAQAQGEIDSAARVAKGYAYTALGLHGDNTRMDIQAGYEKDLLLTEYEPLGLIVAITPFNFPVSLMIHKVIPALLMGNSVVVKPAEDTPLTTLELVRLLHEAGVPLDALGGITGSGREIGDTLTGHPLVRKVSFTGSTGVGRRVGRSVMNNFARVTLELGGNDAALVFPDADLELAADRIVTTRFAVSGQVCCSNKRILVASSIYSEFRDLLVERVSGLVMGDPSATTSSLGPLVNTAAAIGVHEQVQSTIAQGATALVGGSKPNGAFYNPTLLDGVRPDMDIARDMEVFGPVLPMISFDTEDEALKIANDSMFGLNGAVFTNDIGRAIRVSNRMEAGTVVVNGGSFYRPDILAFGGYKASGMGREGLRDSLQACAQIKNVALRNVL